MSDSDYEEDLEDSFMPRQRKSETVSAISQLEILSFVNSIHMEMMSSAPPPKYRLPESVDRPYLRGSDMPICPMKLALDTNRVNQRTQFTSFMKDFYTSIGSVFHELVQKWFGVSGVMFGKWECPHCKKLYPEGSSKEDSIGVLGPVVCTCRKFPTYCNYVEFNPMNIPDTGEFKGHVDGVALIHGKYIVLEFKTTDTDKVRRRRQHGADPKHEVQASSYRYVLPQFLNIPEDQWWNFILIIYYDRADPRNNVPLCIPYAPERFEEEIHKFVSTKKKLAKKQFHLIEGLCRHATDERFCPYNSLCFSPQRDTLIEEILPGYMARRRPSK